MDEKKYHYPSSDNERAIADKNREARACGLSYGAYIAGVSNVRNEQSTKRVHFWWNEEIKKSRR